jgi:chemotaxis protein MotB
MAKKQEAHHGGAWKVAYADFVTAMMALFMVLWISAQDKEILIATSQYFQNPFRSPMDATSGVLPFNSNRTSQSQGKEQGDAKEQSDRNKQIQMTFLNSVASDFYRLLHVTEDFKDKPIDIQVTSDGLRITLFDRAKQPLFAPGSTELTEWGTFVLQNLAWMIDRHQFSVTIDGHARANQPISKPDYSNWELSADRANAARRTLVHYAVAPALIERVIGYGDTKPIPGESADADSNERVTLNLTLTAKPHGKENKLPQRATASSVGATP